MPYILVLARQPLSVLSAYRRTNTCCLLPLELDLGDKLCVIYGLPVPFVIRPDGDEYLLVGECYVQGVMDGEVMDMAHIETQYYIEIRYDLVMPCRWV